MIRRGLIFFVLALYPLAAQSENWIRREITRPITSHVYMQDFRAKGRLDILVFNDRTFQYYPQEPRNHFSSKPSQTFAIPSFYLYFDFFKNDADASMQIALMSHKGVDVLPLKDDIFTSPPSVLIKDSLPLPADSDEFNRINFVRRFDSAACDDFIVPDKSCFKIYMADDYSTPALRIPFDLSNDVVFLSLGVPPQVVGRNMFLISKQHSFERTKLFEINYSYGAILSSVPDLKITDATENTVAQLRLGSEVWECLNGKWSAQKEPNLSENSLPEDDAASDALYGEDSFSYKHLFDFNHDGVKDSVIYNTQASAFSPLTTVKVFLAGADGTLSSKPFSEVRAAAVSPFMDGVPIMDVDGDGYVDLILFNPETKGTSVSSNLKNFLTKGITGQIIFYLWEKDKGFPKSPTFSFPAKITPDWINYISPAFNYLNVGVDLTGDGKPDLLLQTGAKEYSLFPFINRKKGFSAKAAYIFKLPEEADDFNLLDMNGDGFHDIIFTSNSIEKQISLDVIFFLNIK